MPIRDLARELSGQSHSAPFCVVGAGIAGLLLATRLARHNRKVIVVESGTVAFDPAIHELNDIDDAGGGYGRAMTGRYRGLGGSSSRWGGRMIPIAGFDQGAREHVDQPEWPVAPHILRRYQQELEALFGVGHDSFDELDTRAPGSAGLLIDTGEDFMTRWAKCPTFKRCNIISILGREIRSNPNITVWLNATVWGFDLDTEAGKLRAITAKSLYGHELTVRAEEFALAAGTIESTRLLLLLDAASGNRAFERTEALGRYFQDHLKAEVALVDRTRADLTNHLLSCRFVRGIRRDLHLELSGSAQREDQVSSGFIYVAMDMGNSGMAAIKSIAKGVQRQEVEPRQIGTAVRDVGLIAKSGFWRFWHKQLYVPPAVDLRLMALVEQLPDPGNRISLSEKTDQMGVRKALLHWKVLPRDERTFRSAARRLRTYWSRAGLDNLCPLIWAPGVNSPDGQIIETVEACAHPSGSTRMGTNPASSVVGPDLRCHHVPNVAVASASVFPTAGSANPTFTIMQLALWLADSYLLIGA
ncbi:GMC family oxidoreductase [Devosia sp. 1635]|uniref:GMC oxidoreductase n=1 Tax=Devosia sp. 1635 TaxID=2726066 RepID=UPI001563665C|nr:GMC family oxidoreductase [Devosia sp. 1635]